MAQAESRHTCCERIQSWVLCCEGTRPLAFKLGAFTAVEYLASLSQNTNIYKVFQSNDTRVQFHLSPFTYPFTGI
jgi:hypothetical protein